MDYKAEATLIYDALEKEDTDTEYPQLSYIQLSERLKFAPRQQTLQKMLKDGAIFLRKRGYCLIYPWPEWEQSSK